MPLYEHVFISRQDLSSAQAEGLVEHFGQVLSDNGGRLVESEYWGLKTMAYKINKNCKGHYAFMKTDSKADAIQEMERLMRLHEDVLRYMSIRVEEHEEEPSVMMQSKSNRDDRGRGHNEERPEAEAAAIVDSEAPAAAKESTPVADGAADDLADDKDTKE